MVMKKRTMTRRNWRDCLVKVFSVMIRHYRQRPVFETLTLTRLNTSVTLLALNHYYMITITITIQNIENTQRTLAQCTFVCRKPFL